MTTAMAANVDIVREVMEIATERPMKFLDRYDEFFCEDFEWFPATEPVDGVTYRGREGMAAYWAQIDEMWERFEPSDLRYEALGKDTVVVLGRLSIRGREGGVTLDSENGVCFWLRGGRLARGRSFLSHAEALEAARA